MVKHKFQEVSGELLVCTNPGLLFQHPQGFQGRWIKEMHAAFFNRYSFCKLKSAFKLERGEDSNVSVTQLSPFFINLDLLSKANAFVTDKCQLTVERNYSPNPHPKSGSNKEEQIHCHA